jgi:hypothetical protein
MSLVIHQRESIYYDPVEKQITICEKEKNGYMTHKMYDISRSIREIDYYNERKSTMLPYIIDVENRTLYVSENNEVVLSVVPGVFGIMKSWKVVMVGGGIIYPTLEITYIHDDIDFIRSVSREDLCINHLGNWYYIDKYTATMREFIISDDKKYFEKHGFTVNYPAEEGSAYYKFRVVLMRHNGELTIKYYPGNTEVERK